MKHKHPLLEKKIPYSNIKYITAEIVDRMPALYVTEDVPASEKRIQVKFFTPDSNWTWYITEASAILEDGRQIALSEITPDMDIEDILMFGLVHGLEREWGYVSYNELLALRGPWGLPVERDIHFTPMRAGAYDDL